MPHISSGCLIFEAAAVFLEGNVFNFQRPQLLVDNSLTTSIAEFCGYSFFCSSKLEQNPNLAARSVYAVRAFACFTAPNTCALSSVSYTTQQSLSNLKQPVTPDISAKVSLSITQSPPTPQAMALSRNLSLYHFPYPSNCFYVCNSSNTPPILYLLRPHLEISSDKLKIV